MIDVVAQSGRYPPNASALAGFLVEGEQHYWVHVAIDRFTRQVIDRPEANKLSISQPGV